MNQTVRRARRQDVDLFLTLLREFARQQNLSDELIVTKTRVYRDFFGVSARVRVILAECDGVVTGFSTYFYTYTTFRGRSVLYIEDLYVRDEYRSHGVGRALLGHLRSQALRRKCSRMELLVQDQTDAVSFYQHHGGQCRRNWIPVRFSLEKETPARPHRFVLGGPDV